MARPKSPSKKSLTQPSPDPWALQWQSTLGDYGSAIAWSPDGEILAAASAMGEVVLYGGATGMPTPLLPSSPGAISALGFDATGQYLAAVGQGGRGWVWQRGEDGWALEWPLHLGRPWLDTLAWHPQHPWMALGVGGTVQVWDMAQGQVTATLAFGPTSVLALAWDGTGERLAVAGNQGVQVWRSLHWDHMPQGRETGTVTGAIAWSGDGQYLAAGNHDGTVLVWPGQSPAPWRMEGFSGKVQHLAWGQDAQGIPCLGTAGGVGLALWRPQGHHWQPLPLEMHQAPISGIGFQPGSDRLASVGEDGWLGLWGKDGRLTQWLPGASQGFSALAWQPQGTALAAVGAWGEVLVWRQRPRGFGDRA